MLRTIVALASAPLLLAVAKKKTTRIKRAARPASRSGQKRVGPKPVAKRIAVAPSNKKGVQPRVETPEKVVEPAPPPPKPIAPVQAPALFSPRLGEPSESLTPSFRWFYVGSASHYELVWSLDVHFHKAHILFTNQTAASLPPDQALAPGTTYVWRVRGGNEGGWGPWSTTRTFTTPAE
jgi:hypothetical protein